MACVGIISQANRIYDQRPESVASDFYELTKDVDPFMPWMSRAGGAAGAEAGAPQRASSAEQPDVASGVASFAARAHALKAEAEAKLKAMEAENRRAQIAAVRDEIVEIYREHNPRKLADVDELLAEWKGEEQKLLASVRTKYVQAAGAEQQREAADRAAPRARFAQVAAACKDRQENSRMAAAEAALAAAEDAVASASSKAELRRAESLVHRAIRAVGGIAVDCTSPESRLLPKTSSCSDDASDEASDDEPAPDSAAVEELWERASAVDGLWEIRNDAIFKHHALESLAKGSYPRQG